MAPGVRNTVLGCLAFVALVVGIFVYNTVREPTLDEDALRERGVYLLPRPRDIAPFELTDAQGGTFTDDDLEGHWTFAFFGYTSCPDICPVALSVLGQVQRQLREQNPTLADDFHVLFVSVDPERDDPKRLREYTQAFAPKAEAADANDAAFRAVTAERAALAELARQVNVAFGKAPNPNAPNDGDDYLVDHSGNIVIINPRGHYHGFVKLPHEVETVKLAYQSLAARF